MSKDSQSLDISPMLKNWDYVLGDVVVRKIKGLDDREKVQMRLALGVIQMEAEGRPDGLRPHGYESLLEYHEAQLEKHQSIRGDEKDFRLKPEECGALREEATSYYYRYLSLFQLGEYAGAARDTARNLRVIGFLKAYAANDLDRFSMERYRPYIIMMNVRSRAHVSLGKKDFYGGERIVRGGIAQIVKFLNAYGKAPDFSECRELEILQTFLQDIQDSRPVPTLEKLRLDLAAAVEQEDFECAARLRDEIRALEGSKKSK